MVVWVRWVTLLCVGVGVVVGVGPRTPVVARPSPRTPVVARPVPRTPVVATGKHDTSGQEAATRPTLHIDRQDTSNIALLQELRTITDLILRGQKKGK